MTRAVTETTACHAMGSRNSLPGYNPVVQPTTLAELLVQGGLRNWRHSPRNFAARTELSCLSPVIFTLRWP